MLKNKKLTMFLGASNELKLFWNAIPMLKRQEAKAKHK